MKRLEEMDYSEFGNLRFLDFFQKSDLYYDDQIGELECGIGLACAEGYGPTYFARQIKKKRETAEINLDFDNNCPEAQGNSLLSHLGLELRKGMSGRQVKEAMGNPIEESATYMEFVVGSKWPYYIACYIRDQGGLFKVWICRKDLADKEREREEL